MFNYHQPNLENMQQYLNQEQEKSSGNGPNWFSIPAGMSSIRILPPWDPTGRVALPVFMHPIEYQEEGSKYKKYNWTCVNKTFSKSCPICEGLAGLAASGVDTSNWEANRRQYYFNAIVMRDPTYNAQKNTGTAPGTHVLLKAPKTFYDWVISQITNPMIGDITSVTNGIDIYVTKEGTGLGTSYNMTLSPNGRTPIPQEYLEKITDLYNLDDIFSAGFEQKQIDGLVSHLKKSAGVMSNAVGNAVNQMAGYTQAPMTPPAPAGMPFTYGAPQTTGYPPVTNPVAPMPNQFGSPTPSVGMPAAPSPFSMNQTGTPPWTNPTSGDAAPTVPTPTPAPAAPSNGMPKCFGQYDPGSVNCVVCPVEMNCSKAKNG